LLTGYRNAVPQIQEALATRTFYVVPRINPDGVEAALSQTNPSRIRSSTRQWPRTDLNADNKPPGLYREDIDGDGRILQMRIKDDHGSWVEHPKDSRVMIPFDHPDSPYQQRYSNSDTVTIQTLPQRYRILTEGLIHNYDGFTIPTPMTTQKLDLNRNFPALWGKEVNGSGDHAMSEPEVNYLVRAISAHPNVCGYNTYHTCGGFLIYGPASPDKAKEMSHIDVWTWKEVSPL
jgi:murein tripeptide amidase MpaA